MTKQIFARISEELEPVWEAIPDKRKFIENALLGKTQTFSDQDLALSLSKEQLHNIKQFLLCKKLTTEIKILEERVKQEPQKTKKLEIDVQNIRNKLGVRELTCVHCGTVSIDPKIQYKEGVLIRICPKCGEPDPGDADKYFNRGRVK